MLYYVPAGLPGAWMDAANIESTVIDDAPGQPFESQAVDLNLDGKHCTVNTRPYSAFFTLPEQEPWK